MRLMVKIFVVLTILILCFSLEDSSQKLMFYEVLKQNTKPIEGNQKPIDAEDIPFDVADNKNSKSNKGNVTEKINHLIGKTLKKWCDEAKTDYPPACVLFRTFKLEKEFEIWGGNRVDDLQLIQTIKICSFDSQPGPKLFEGDGKTPEGFYTCDLSYGSPYWWMWIKLTAEDVDETGVPNNGSCFKICINYPNSSDIARSKIFVGKKSPGSEICIHGNCVSAGCISFKNRAFLPVFYFASHHQYKKYGAIQIQIYPFRFSEKSKQQYCNSYNLMDEKGILGFWNNLEEAYNLFEKKHVPLKYQYKKDKYLFSY